MISIVFHESYLHSFTSVHIVMMVFRELVSEDTQAWFFLAYRLPVFLPFFLEAKRLLLGALLYVMGGWLSGADGTMVFRWTREKFAWKLSASSNLRWFFLLCENNVLQQVHIRNNLGWRFEKFSLSDCVRYITWSEQRNSQRSSLTKRLINFNRISLGLQEFLNYHNFVSSTSHSLETQKFRTTAKIFGMEKVSLTLQILESFKYLAFVKHDLTNKSVILLL